MSTTTTTTNNDIVDNNNMDSDDTTRGLAAAASQTTASSSSFRNSSSSNNIPTFDGDEQAKATDFANYFCAYAQLYHQKQMLTDHNRMAAYHAAIMGNPDVFRDKVVMDVGTGSGILAGE